MFISKTKREIKPPKTQDEIPSVGTYFPLNNTIADNVRKKAEQGSGNPMYMLFKSKDGVPFASSDIRFKEHKIDESD